MPRAATLVLFWAGMAVAACGSRATLPASDVAPGPGAPERRCERTVLEGIGEDPGDLPAGAPYPTPAGGRVTPEIRGVPLPPPDAVEIDGFTRPETAGPRNNSHQTVQVFETAWSEDKILAFYDEALRSQGWVLQGRSLSPAGVECTFVWAKSTPGRAPDEWLTVSTEYNARESEQAVQPPPGFRGKGVPFAPPAPGRRWYWIISPR